MDFKHTLTSVFKATIVDDKSSHIKKSKPEEKKKTSQTFLVGSPTSEGVPVNSTYSEGGISKFRVQIKCNITFHSLTSAYSINSIN